MNDISGTYLLFAIIGLVFICIIGLVYTDIKEEKRQNIIDEEKKKIFFEEQKLLPKFRLCIESQLTNYYSDVIEPQYGGHGRWIWKYTSKERANKLAKCILNDNEYQDKKTGVTIPTYSIRAIYLEEVK